MLHFFGYKNPKILLSVAFLTGLCVIGLEIAASRLLAPLFGTSIFVWSNIIAVVLLALAIGYYVGGKVADKNSDGRTLGWLIFIAGLIFLLVPFLSEPVAGFFGRLVYDRHPGTLTFSLTSFLAALALFGLPLFFLGMISPILVKLYNGYNNKVGESAGAVFAASTAGSIFGTMLPALWLLPAFGTTKTILIFAGILIILGLPNLGIKKILALILMSAAAFGASRIEYADDSDYRIIYQGESPYHHIKVVEDGQQNRYMVFNEALSIESVYNEQEILTGAFYDYFAVLPYLFPEDEPVDVLVLGLAGATIPRQLNYFFGDRVRIDAVEIDQKVIDLSRQYFDLDDLKLNTITEDGRAYLARTDKKYDIVMVDVFQNELYIPWTMTTREFWQLVDARLTDRGLSAINVHASSANSPLIQAIAQTQAAVFNKVYFTDYLKGRGFSYMLTGSRRDLDFSFNSAGISPELAAAAAGMAHTTAVAHEADVRILTDDWAPIEHLSEHSVEFYRKQKSF